MTRPESDRQVLSYRAPVAPVRAAGWETVVWYVLLGLYGAFALGGVIAIALLCFVVSVD